jgi:hypothetical protein
VGIRRDENEEKILFEAGNEDGDEEHFRWWNKK